MQDGTKRTSRAAAASAAVVIGAALAVVAGAPAASAEEPIGTAYPWASERIDDSVPMGDPWGFRGPVDYDVSTQPACIMYPGHQKLVAAVSVTARDRFEPFPFDSDAMFFPVRDTVTIDWTDTATGETGQVVAHGRNGMVTAGVPGKSGPLEMDIHLRSDHPWLQDLGSTDLPVGHSEGTTHATVDLTGKTCD